MPESEEWPEGRPEGRRSAGDARTGSSAAAARIQQQATWVDLQIRQAMARGDFDDLPGAGKPLPDLADEDDPDWWLKRLIERERVTGVLPEALRLRTDDRDLERRLDTHGTEREVRRELEEFNQRIRRARMQLEGGPPVITPERDVDAEIEAWRDRRRERRAAQERSSKAAREQSDRRRRWPRRRT